MAFLAVRHFTAGQGWDSPMGEGKTAGNSLENILQKSFKWIIWVFLINNRNLGKEERCWY